MFTRFLVVCLSSLLFFTSSASAQLYNYHVDDVDSCHNFGIDLLNLPGNLAIKVNYLDITFDETNQEFYVETQITNERGSMSEIFHLVLNQDLGQFPGEGQVAHLYFDATDINNPIVNVYAYNGGGDSVCGNNPGSWEKGTVNDSTITPPDPILSSIAPGPDYFPTDVLEATAFDVVNGPITTRTLRARLRVNNINAHDGIVEQWHPYSFEGIQFGDLVGIWFWAAKDDATSNYSSHFLSQFDTSICAICDQKDNESQQPPEVTGSVSVDTKITECDDITVTFNVHDPDFEDEVTYPIIVTYDELPDGAKPSVPDGEAVTMDAQGNGSVSIFWEPKIGDLGFHNFAATFTKDYGLGQLYDQIEETIEVIECEPECEETEDDPIDQADVELGELNVIAKEIYHAVKNQRKKLGSKRKVDNLDPDAVFEKGWVAYRGIVTSESKFWRCENIQACEGGLQVITLDSEIETFNDSLAELKQINKSRARKYERAKRNVLIKNRGYSPEQAKKKARRNTNQRFRKGKNKDGYIPVSQSAKSHANSYVSAFGTERFICTNANVIN